MAENVQAYDGLDEYESVETDLNEAMGVTSPDASDYIDESDSDMGSAEVVAPEKNEEDHSNPMEHSIADLADAAVEIRWRRQTADETVAARCEIGLGLLNQVTESDEYLAGIKERMLIRNATARQTLKWIEKYEDIETKLADRMAISSDSLVGIINEVIAELTPKAEEEQAETIRSREEKRQARAAQKKAEEAEAESFNTPGLT